MIPEANIEAKRRSFHQDSRPQRPLFWFQVSVMEKREASILV